MALGFQLPNSIMFYGQICHFTARKFSQHAKYTLLDNLDLILSDEEHPYNGNPWDHHQDKLRVNRTTNGSLYYLIENGILREVPDNITMAAFHVKVQYNSFACFGWHLL